MTRRLAFVPGVVLIAAAAAMWGTDALFRKPLAESTSAATIVFGEHVILVLITLPLLVPAMRALFSAGTRYVLAGIAVGAGASADGDHPLHAGVRPRRSDHARRAAEGAAADRDRGRARDPRRAAAAAVRLVRRSRRCSASG